MRFLDARSNVPSGRFLGLVALGFMASALAGPSCTTSGNPTSKSGATSTGSGGGGPAVVPLKPGQICEPPDPSEMRVRADRDAAYQATNGTVFLPVCAAGAACVSRSVTIIVDPDVCTETPITFTTSDPTIVAAPATSSVNLNQPTAVITLKATGMKTGKATISAQVGSPTAGGPAPLSIDVYVLDPTPQACGTAMAQGTVAPAPVSTPSVMGSGGLAGASIGLPPQGYYTSNQGSYLWNVDPFAATVACAPDMPLAGYTLLGPAVTFGPTTSLFKREIPVSIPINPAMLPATARDRHIRLIYSGPAFKAPRTIPVADPRIDMVGGTWAITFKVPRLGTYQAAVLEDAGTKSNSRMLTHRAVIGVSMGSAGAAQFGFRHHSMFDVLAPLGGPSDWTWMLAHIEANHVAGFRSIASGTTLDEIPLAAAACMTGTDCKSDETCVGVIPAAPPMAAMPGKCRFMPPIPTEPYAHPSTYNTWWYEYFGGSKGGNGGTFDRSTYSQIFRDLSLMFGNPNSQSNWAGYQNLPAGVRPDDKSVVGDHPGNVCAVTVDPLGSDVTPAQNATEQELFNDCPKERCSHTLSLNNYYDAKFNPDGTFPVITVCDGSSQNPALSPYSNTWHSDGNQFPLEVALAVDYNGNGVRDELEPIVVQGHEAWDDYGTDGIPDAQEPGYQVGVNEDPNGDDYDAQYNPNGTENNVRWDQGEKFYDYGLDGVPNTKQQPANGWQQAGDGYDVGEGDGKFTMAAGLQRFYDYDAHSIVHQWTDPSVIPSGALTDAALARLDVWTDGGTRDLFNFMAAARHLTGALTTRGRDAAYFTSFSSLPGEDPTNPSQFTPSHINFADLQGAVMQRYGEIDPSQEDLLSGSGEHVGTAGELLNRLQSALYFIGSRWPEPQLRARVAETSPTNVDKTAPMCEQVPDASCTFNFTGTDGRVGPIVVSLPPGYANGDLKWMTYPVIYFLHGYGQTPQDLSSAIALIGNWMNGSDDSSATRLPKAILVYVDGRCRVGATGQAECIQGTFFTDSVRPTGAHIDTWWIELMSYIDAHYRTMGPSTTTWTP